MTDTSFFTLRSWRGKAIAVASVCFLVSGASAIADEVSDDPRFNSYLETVRESLPEGHPRLVMTARVLPQVREAAQGEVAGVYADIRERVDELPAEIEPADWGHQAQDAALVWLVEGEPEMVERTAELLEASLAYYHSRYEQREPVSWYGWSRASWLMALDWIWNELPPERREALGSGILQHLREFRDFGRKIPVEATSGTDSGFYGMQANFWYAGLLLAETGIDDDYARELLEEGLRLHIEMLKHRERGAGESGGGASPTLAYLLGNYPVAEFLFFQSWKSAFGESLAAEWPVSSLLPYYMDWNWLPGNVEFGYGDKVFTDNRYPGYLQFHLRTIMHLYGDRYPRRAAFAKTVLQRTYDYRGKKLASTRLFGLFPFLRSDISDIEAWEPAEWPLAQTFPEMGQTFFRSGRGEDDTYALLVGGGAVASHRHYDAGHFTIFRSGYLALDAGTRESGRDHLVNFFAQTVAHNSLLIAMPDEPLTGYWGTPARVQSHGQNKRLGSEIAAFHTGEHFAAAAIDMTPVYDARKQDGVKRWFLYFPPNRFLVVDAVQGTEESFEKTWLLQTATEPKELGPGLFSIDQGEGRLFSQTIAPAETRVTVAGGPGQEFVVEGEPFPVSEKVMEDGEVPELMGRWRLRINPAVPSEFDLFVHYLETADQNQARPVLPEVEKGNGTLKVSLPVKAGVARVTIPEDGSAAPVVEIKAGEKVIERVTLDSLDIPPLPL